MALSQPLCAGLGTATADTAKDRIEKAGRKFRSLDPELPNLATCEIFLSVVWKFRIGSPR
uniref:Uncharacterized protein n=1 Tax=Oryza sativa subsp. japonica TaxID=39947 RepID=Q6YUD2_ORYSJ|nr:hypothetical protein [Oryza sativa Japonica Group]